VSDRVQIAAQIRFALDQLSAKNKHHDFEHLCRQLTRKKICSNVLPATGPVSAGGDQGMDFETFRTYLDDEGVGDSRFLGLTSNHVIVFCCSLQKDALDQKIIDDVAKILAYGKVVDSVYFFSSQDVNVSVRHKVSSRAREEYSTHLEIFDAQAISELLCDDDTFWIAVRFLDIPSELLPEAQLTESWYSDLRVSWAKSSTRISIFSDFIDLKRASRHAAFHEDYEADRSFWTGVLEREVRSVIPSSLRSKIAYELIFTTYVGQKTLHGFESIVLSYFEESLNSNDIATIEDTAALINLCSGAVNLSAIDMTLTKIEEINHKLTERLDSALSSVQTPSARCRLFEIKGYMELSDALRAGELAPTGVPGWWLRLPDELPHAPFFPLERFSDRLSEFIALFPESEDYRKLTGRIDQMLSERVGKFKAAEKCRDRAIKLYKSGYLLRAIDELHNAKTKWFAEETLKGSILATLQIAEWYLELELSLAAKYYAFAAAYMAINSRVDELKSFVPKTLACALEADYLNGAWIGAFEDLSVLLSTHHLVCREPLNIEKHHHLQRGIFYAVMMKTISEHLGEGYSSVMQSLMLKLDLREALEELLPTSRKSWSNLAESDLRTALEENFKAAPFSDTGSERVFCWLQLGICWTVSWRNDRLLTALAEHIVAVLQIVFSDSGVIFKRCVNSKKVA